MHVVCKWSSLGGSSQLLVIGGIALDITSTMCKSLNPVLYTSTPGKVKQSLGGVGRNVAEAAMRTGANVKLVSVVGNDLAGESILEGMRQLNMVYNAIHSNTGELITAVADMGLFDSMNTSDVNSPVHYPQSVSSV
ncbi:hypothetical protein BDB01DRAFT_842309 [Pilobolus umbonatus]|nr:hypothetical protein BDB01DRAFT_842309 [Pilobolus umbonatus]